MAKPKIPNQRNKYKSLRTRLNKYSLLVQAAVVAYIDDIIQPLFLIDYDGKEPFSFDKFPTIKGQVAEKSTGLISHLTTIFLTGTAMEWAASNETQDTLVRRVLGAFGVQTDEVKGGSEKKLQEFQQRVYGNDTTFGRLNKIVGSMKEEVETAVSVCGGMPVPIIKTKVEEYFGDVKSLRKDFKEKFGYDPDVSDTRYSATSLIASEINIAYREAEQQRWREMDFVIGYEIHQSTTHAERVPRGDICDLLAGKYPKDFRWTGWHPLCRCYAIPILKTMDEYVNDLPSENEVKDIPDNMKQWLFDNDDYLETAQIKGTLPYWIRDNMESEGMVNNKFTDYISSFIKKGEISNDVVSDSEAQETITKIFNSNP